MRARTAPAGVFFGSTLGRPGRKLVSMMSARRHAVLRWTALLALGAANASACSSGQVPEPGAEAGAPGDGGAPVEASVEAAAALPDAAPTPDGAVNDASVFDAPHDVAADVASPDAADAGADAADAGSPDAADAGGPVPLVVGADGVVRGTVSGTFEHRWAGALRATDARCPAGAAVVGLCCEWSGAFAATAVTNVPIEFDPTTRRGTLAGAPIGPYSPGPPPGADGVYHFMISPSSFNLDRAWVASEAMGLHQGETAPVRAASSAFFALGIAREVLISVSSSEVTWDPALVRLTVRDAHPLTPAAGACGVNTSGRTAFLLRSL